MSVFVLDTNKTPLAPCHEDRARRLLKSGKAALYRRFPFTIILKRAVENPHVPDLRVRLDPGSKTTGIAVVDDQSGQVVFAAELSHRAHTIKGSLDDRRAVRRSRRNRKTRYRKARWQNRKRKEGWLPPSLESRIANILTWIARLRKFSHITSISLELVSFDMQLMQNPEISGVEYQQGTLAGYETREYLLQKWGRKCAYCSKENIPLQIEHIVPRAKGGSNRVSNLCLSCEKCNLAKGSRSIEDYLKKKPELLKKILAQAKTPLKDAAAVNATRWELFRRLQGFALPIECGSGGLTKFNRTTRELSKTHWLDAACVGKSTPEVLVTFGVQPLLIKACGHGCRQMCLPDKYGFPRTSAKGAKSVKGFQTGDIVRAIITSGQKGGTYVGRVAVRSTGSFNVTTGEGTVQGISYKYCKALHRMDGYSYHLG
ncbi:HNH endonuclease [Ktedonosporobacter rubrisoli]|uniref:HNH endonuclease n=1 Tax=Ktedonosporobacter rubrisoli TaxID=2509675 RepID=A0A4P6JU48_KTERU|nr:RNA-guided endonuclease IscB [Ktedonosporobacter rubrisoli]QBD79127.1 HNH endonuclease [Ktedonosporobacter rubrisoli]